MSLLRARRDDVAAAGIRVFGVSRDSPWSHVAWRQVLDLDFPLLSDWSAEATRAFGLAIEVRGLEDVARRSAFLVDGEGIIRGAWLYETGEVPDVDELLAAARALTRPPA
ncbi:MAG: redoxin domain-containing protein [Thermoleophilia bacterium]